MQKTLQALAFSAALFAGAAAVQAQGYSQNFDTFTPNDYLTDGQDTTGGSGQGGWLTTDPYNVNSPATESVGGSDDVLPTASISGYAGFSGYAASLGGNIRNSGSGFIVVPGSTSPSDYHTFTPITTQNYQLNVDFVLSVQGTNPATSTDSFAFSLRNASNTPLLTINITPSSTTGTDNLGTAIGTGANVRSPNGINLNGSYHLTVQVNPVTGAYTATYYKNGIAGTFPISSGTFAGAATVNQVAVVWNLTNPGAKDGNGGYQGASTDAILFDNIAVTVPEPSTYAALGVGLLALVGLRKRLRA